MIGTITPAEWSEEQDPKTGRRLRRLTDGQSNAYSLYYFVPSVTPDGRYLVFHSERDGTVQLYRIDLQSGEIGTLTDGHTRDAGWAIWCAWHLDGIFNHLSAIDPGTGEVFYFQDDEIRATDVATFANRIVRRLPRGRMPIGQTALSPSGRWFAYVHVDAAAYRELLQERERRTAEGVFSWAQEHHQVFRNRIGATLAVVDTLTGDEREVMSTDFHFHHVLFLDEETLLINHPKGCAGMWSVRLDGSAVRHLRTPDLPGAHGAMVNHQVVTLRGVAYEAVAYPPGDGATYLGMYEPETGMFREARLPLEGYVHVGFDPLGLLDFIECSGQDHELLVVHGERASGTRVSATRIRRLNSPDHDEQRFHAHPYMANSDRRWLYFTDLSEQGFAQICAVDVADLSA